MVILKFYTVPMFFACCQKLYKQENSFKQTPVNFFFAKYDVISQLRHSYAKGPFCVAQLIYVYVEVLAYTKKGLKYCI